MSGYELEKGACCSQCHSICCTSISPSLLTPPVDCLPKFRVSWRFVRDFAKVTDEHYSESYTSGTSNPPAVLRKTIPPTNNPMPASTAAFALRFAGSPYSIAHNWLRNDLGVVSFSLICCARLGGILYEFVKWWITVAAVRRCSEVQ